MEDPTTADTISTILTAILGTGGVATVIAAVKAWRTRHSAPPVEQAAVVQVGADWEALNRYWRAEVNRIRAEQKNERHEWNIERNGYRKNIRWLRRRVDALEMHIWQGKPPPPPPEPEDDNTEG